MKLFRLLNTPIVYPVLFFIRMILLGSVLLHVFEHTPKVPEDNVMIGW